MLRFDFSEADRFSRTCQHVQGNMGSILRASQLRMFELPMNGMTGVAGIEAQRQIRTINDGLRFRCAFLDFLQKDFAEATKSAGRVKRDVESVPLTVGAMGNVTDTWTHSVLIIADGAPSQLASRARAVSAESIANMAKTLSELMGTLPSGISREASDACRSLSRELALQGNMLLSMANSLDELSDSVIAFERRYTQAPDNSLASFVNSFSASATETIGSIAPNALADTIKGSAESYSDLFEEKALKSAEHLRLDKFDGYEIKEIPDEHGNKFRHIEYTGAETGANPKTRGNGITINSNNPEYQVLLDETNTSKGLSAFGKVAGAAGWAATAATSLQTLNETGRESYDRHAELSEKDRAAVAHADMALKGFSILSGIIAGAAVGAGVGAACGGIPAIPGAIIGAVVGGVASSIEEKRVDSIVDADFNHDGQTIRTFVQDSYKASPMNFATREIGDNAYIDPNGYYTEFKH